MSVWESYKFRQKEKGVVTWLWVYNEALWIIVEPEFLIYNWGDYLIWILLGTMHCSNILSQFTDISWVR